jgi:isocitrate dehydrogenase (NAD+)
MHAVLVPGDGIGPEIAAAACAVVDATGVDVTWEERPAGLVALNSHGHVAPPETLQAIRAVGAALKGPSSTPTGGGHHSANHYIRRELELYANLRPITDRTRGIDVLLVRENIEDHYAAIEWTAAPGVAEALKVVTRAGSKRVAQFACELAAREGRRRLTVVHKANNLKLTEGLFLGTAAEVAAGYPALEVDDLIVDAAAAQLVTAPESLDVLLMTNTFGDILSNVGAAVVGSLGLLPSANYGPDGLVLAEGGHGSAPELAGTGRANPLGIAAAAGLLLEAKGYKDEAAAIAAAVEEVKQSGACTPDLGGDASTDEVAVQTAQLVRRRLAGGRPRARTR